MPPPLALLLCTSFVYFLLRLDHRKVTGVTPALWVPTLWLFSIATKPIGVWLSSSVGDESGSPLDQAFLIVVMFWGLEILRRRRFDWLGALRDQPWFLALLLYMLLSIAWSDLPFTSFKRYIRELVAVVMALVVASEPDPRQAIECILRRSAYILVPFSLILAKYYPEYGVEFGRWTGEHMWVGVATQKNGLGRVCIVAIPILVLTLLRRREGRDAPVGKYQTHAELLVLLLALYLLLNPEGKSSATAIVTLAVGMSGFLGLRWLHRGGMRVALSVLLGACIAIIGFGVALPLSGGAIGSGFNEAIGRDATFTGRAETWAELGPIAMKHPALGCGFGGFWTPATRELYEMSNAHSAYLEMLMELGLVGILLFSMFMLSIARSAHRLLASDFDLGSLGIFFLTMVLIYGTTESDGSSFTSQMPAVLLFLAFCCAATELHPRSAVEDDSILNRHV